MFSTHENKIREMRNGFKMKRVSNTDINKLNSRNTGRKSVSSVSLNENSKSFKSHSLYEEHG